jgi:hypothetical protein
MRLIDDAEKVLKNAWSVRLIVLGVVLQAGAVVLPLMMAVVPPSMLVGYGLVTFVVVAGAGCARFIKQDNLSANDSGAP